MNDIGNIKIIKFDLATFTREDTLSLTYGNSAAAYDSSRDYICMGSGSRISIIKGNPFSVVTTLANTESIVSAVVG